MKNLFNEYRTKIWADGADLDAIMAEIRADDRLTEDESEALEEYINSAYEP